MPQTCSICRNPQRDAIDAALIAGEALRSIAKRFGTSASAVFRHRNSDLSPALIQAKTERDSEHADTLLDQVRCLTDKAIELLAKAEKEGDTRGAFVGIREARGCMELVGKLTGELTTVPETLNYQPMFILPPGTHVAVGCPKPQEIDVTPKHIALKDGST